MRLVRLIAAASAALVVSLPAMAGAKAETAAAPTGGYIVELKAPPLASYTGGQPGITGTSPKATGQRKLDTTSGAATSYTAVLDAQERAVLTRTPGVASYYSYRVAFTGFAADLTSDQVGALRRDPRVAHVFPNDKAQIQSNPNLGDPNQVDAALGGPKGESPSYLGLPKGIWNDLGGVDSAGNGVIVGVIDTGIWPEHPSFAANPNGPGNTRLYLGSPYGAPPASWHGTCQPGDRWTASTCNNKLIGARWYLSGFGKRNIPHDEFRSARDADGHGSHTASTAAGNFGVDPSIAGSDLGVDLISGVAPRARVAAYKVCWIGKGVADGCTNADSVKAIDDAVADGVDVINYSVGGTTSNVIDATEFAFLGASDAGVFVANSAGNSGPDPETVGTPTTVPWLTSVGANQIARTSQSTVTLTPAAGSPFNVSGASVTGAITNPTPVVDAALSASAGTAPADAELCLPGSLDPAKVSGKIVLCKRGNNARVEKGKVVKDAGGVGLILYNVSDAQELVTDTHWVPGVHVSNTDGLAVKSAIANGPVTATKTAGTRTPLPRGAIMAAFSSRGPQTAVPDLPKPDVTGPGVNILAAASPEPAVNTELFPGQLFQSISGTSMSSPHVAGAGALLAQLHPTWSSARIKSALMTTANSNVLKENGVTPATPFDAGSGEINPTAAENPGLVFDVSTNDYVRYVDSQDPTIFDDGQTPIQPTDLNLPSISNHAVPGSLTTKRTVTSVDAVSRNWKAAIRVKGFTATVSPATFTIAPGASQELTITFKRTTAPLDVYQFGTMTLTNGPRVLHLPVSLQPIAVAAPATIAVSTAQSSGSQQFTVTPGYDGTLSAAGWGLAAGTPHTAQTISTSPTGAPDPSAPATGQNFYDVTVPANSQLLSGRISNADGGDPNTDLDLFVYYDADNNGFTDDELVGVSASAIADEAITMTFPAAGSYRFVVVGFTTKSPSIFDFTTWVVQDSAPDSTTPSPSIVVSGDPLSVSTAVPVQLQLDWNGVLLPGLYLGIVTYHTSGAPPTAANAVASSVVELTKT